LSKNIYQGKSDLKEITVIIPTRSRADLLGKAIESLACQTLSKDEFEVVVVDNGSTDQTADLVLTYAKRWTNWRYVYESTPGLHSGRHRGLKEAKGDVLVYADDDIRATPTWLEAIAENFADPKVSMAGGNNYPDFKGPVPEWLNRLWAKPSMGGQGISYLSILSLPEGRHEINPYLVWGCNFSVRKQVVLDAGGFHPDGVPQELIRFRGDGESHISKYVLEKKMRCVFDSRASVYHAVTENRMTFDYFRQRAFNQGVSDSYTRLRNRRKHRSPADYPRAIARRLFSGISRCGRRTIEKDAELQKLAVLMRDGHQEGLEYHQRIYQSDAEVRAWVHKQDYF
jgi:glycosyltransferase involved in cell wall biosynthesis